MSAKPLREDDRAFAPHAMGLSTVLDGPAPAGCHDWQVFYAPKVRNGWRCPRCGATKQDKRRSGVVMVVYTDGAGRVVEYPECMAATTRAA